MIDINSAIKFYTSLKRKLGSYYGGLCGKDDQGGRSYKDQPQVDYKKRKKEKEKKKKFSYVRLVREVWVVRVV